MRMLVMVGAAIAAALSVDLVFGAGGTPSVTGKLRGNLVAAVDAAEPDALVPITIVMATQLDGDAAAAIGAGRDKATRRTLMVRALTATATATQGPLRTVLEAGRDAGAVSDRIRPLWIRNVIATAATPAMIRTIAGRADVAYVSHDPPVGEEIFPVQPGGGEVIAGSAEPGEGPIECGVELMGAPDVWNDLGFTGDGVVVAVIDTGVCITHPDLADHIWNNDGEVPGNGADDDSNGYVDDVVGWNFRDETNDPFDDNSHGTHVAGTVVGDGTNGTRTGMAPGARVMPLKIWNSFSGESLVWEAMQYAVDNGADAISVSLGWPHGLDPDRATWRIVCENTMFSGVVVIYAVGNEGECCGPLDNVRTPGDVPGMLTVGATDCGDQIAGFSSRGPVSWETVEPFLDWPHPPGKTKPTLSAPGVGTISTFNDCTSYLTLSGTSMATPHVAGATALMLEANPFLDHFQIKQLMKLASIDLGPPGRDNVFGAGRLDVMAAVLSAIDLRPVADPDLDDDGDVDFSDLLQLLASWGACPPPPSLCPADLDGSGGVEFGDLLTLLAAWG